MAGLRDPTVMVINERAGSGGDLLPFLFRVHGIGSLGSSCLAPEPQLRFAARGGNFVDRYFGAFDDGFGNARVEKAGEYRGTLSSFDVRAPRIARVRFAPWWFEPHVLAGAVPALRLYGTDSGNRILRDFESGSFRRADLGWTAGIGTRWPTRHGVMAIDLRFEEGGAEVFRNGRGPPGRIRAWMLGVGRRTRGGGDPPATPTPTPTP